MAEDDQRFLEDGLTQFKTRTRCAVDAPASEQLRESIWKAFVDSDVADAYDRSQFDLCISNLCYPLGARVYSRICKLGRQFEADSKEGKRCRALQIIQDLLKQEPTNQRQRRVRIVEVAPTPIVTTKEPTPDVVWKETITRQKELEKTPLYQNAVPPRMPDPEEVVQHISGKEAEPEVAKPDPMVETEPVKETPPLDQELLHDPEFKIKLREHYAAAFANEMAKIRAAHIHEKLQTKSVVPVKDPVTVSTVPATDPPVEESATVEENSDGTSTETTSEDSETSDAETDEDVVAVPTYKRPKVPEAPKIKRSKRMRDVFQPHHTYAPHMYAPQPYYGYGYNYMIPPVSVAPKAKKEPKRKRKEESIDKKKETESDVVERKRVKSPIKEPEPKAESKPVNTPVIVPLDFTSHFLGNARHI